MKLYISPAPYDTLKGTKNKKLRNIYKFMSEPKLPQSSQDLTKKQLTELKEYLKTTKTKTKIKLKKLTPDEFHAICNDAEITPPLAPIKHRMCKRSVAELVKISSLTHSVENATLRAFKVDFHLDLTKTEQKIALRCFAIGQADLNNLMLRALLTDSRMANNMKTLGQIISLISENEQEAKQIATSLNINLTDKKSKAVPPDADADSNQSKRKPPTELKLVNNDGA